MAEEGVPDDEVLYVIEDIIGKKARQDGKVFYRVKWEDWHASTNTWEVAEEVKGRLVKEYEKRVASMGQLPHHPVPGLGFFVNDCPEDVTLLSVEGITKQLGKTGYLVKVSTTPELDDSDVFDERNMAVVESKAMQRYYMEELVKFHESRMKTQWKRQKMLDKAPNPKIGEVLKEICEPPSGFTPVIIDIESSDSDDEARKGADTDDDETSDSDDDIISVIESSSSDESDDSQTDQAVEYDFC